MAGGQKEKSGKTAKTPESTGRSAGRPDVVARAAFRKDAQFNSLHAADRMRRCHSPDRARRG
jgi:hypothetical protein